MLNPHPSSRVHTIDRVDQRFVLVDWLQELGDPSGEWIVSWLCRDPVDPERARGSSVSPLRRE